jgi:oligogalacturonide lyase
VVYSDGATEFPVTRLTSPSYASHLPKNGSRVVSSKRNYLVFVSDRAGTLQAYDLDLKSGRSRLLTRAAQLALGTLTLSPDERDIVYFDDDELVQTRIQNLRHRSLYSIPDGWGRGEGLAISPDGGHAVFVERCESRWRIRLLDLKKQKASVVVEESERLHEPIPRPGRQSLLYRKGDRELWTIGYDGKQRRKLPVAAGTPGPANWSRDGVSLFYLNFPPQRTELNALRVHYADSGQDRLVAKTTQFVAFGANADASAFVGASGGRASPHIILLLRATGRELILCEHFASDPSAVSPIFSPNSRQIFFESDRDGKPAIYTMMVDKLVESTQS